MNLDERQQLVVQRAMNAQTVQFVAEQQEEMAELATDQARREPGWATVAELERARAKTLMEVAKEESRLATEIMLGREPADLVAAEERELRKDLLEIARMENAIAETMKADHTEDDAAAISVAEQAQRNRDLLRHVARTATEADRELRTGTREK